MTARSTHAMLLSICLLLLVSTVLPLLAAPTRSETAPAQAGPALLTYSARVVSSDACPMDASIVTPDASQQTGLTTWPKTYRYWIEYDTAGSAKSTDGSMEVGWWGSCDKIVVTGTECIVYDGDGVVLFKGPYSRDETVTVVSGQTASGTDVGTIVEFKLIISNP